MGPYALILRLLTRIHFSGNLVQDTQDAVYVMERPYRSHRTLLRIGLRERKLDCNPDQIISLDNANQEHVQKQIETLVAHQRNHPDKVIALLPIMLFHGHLPSQEKGFFKTLFAESWDGSSRINRALQILFNGRETLLRADPPLLLTDLYKPDLSDQEVARRAIWVLRNHFHRGRMAIIGPDLSHRRTLLSQIIKSTDVQEALEEESKKSKRSALVLEREVHHNLEEIAADFSPITARILNRMITLMMNRLYQKVHLSGLDQVQQLALTHTLVYLPCHRSHMDYILISWALYRHGLMVPHVVSGNNLNIPVIGPLLKRGGAIFMRRQFKGDKLYQTLFRRYMTLMQHRGHSLEYFIEAGRSRSGRLLTPKTGLLGMTTEAWHQDPSRPVALIPIWIGYDRIAENRTYQNELSGAGKSQESLLDTLSAARILLQKHGEVTLSFGEPIKLELMDAQLQKEGIQHLGQTVLEHINAAARPTQMSLLASILLSSPDLTLSRQVLEKRCTQLIFLLPQEAADSITLSEPVSHWINAARKRQQISIDGDQVWCTPEQATELTFYRNNLLHLLMLPGLMLLLSRRLPQPGSSTITRLIKGIHPFLSAELTIASNDKLLSQQIMQTRQTLIEQGLLQKQEQLLIEQNRPLAQHLIRLVEPLLLRQYMMVCVLEQQPRISIDTLIDVTRDLAIKVHRKYGYDAPEYAERRLMEGLVEQLLSSQLLEGERDCLWPARSLAPILRLGEKILPPSLTQLIQQSLKVL